MGATPSWFDKLTMRATARTDAYEALILSLSKDEGRVRCNEIPRLAVERVPILGKREREGRDLSPRTGS